MEQTKEREMAEFIALAKSTKDRMTDLINMLEHNETIRHEIGFATDRIKKLTEEYTEGLTLASAQLLWAMMIERGM